MSESDSSGASELPVHGILALEAVARLGSVQAAADELSVTPSGISHRLATLERRIGQPLLQKRGRGVTLTDVAQAYVAAARPALHRLAGFTGDLVDREQGTVRVATAAAIGLACMLPAMKRFSESHPGARFELRTVALADELFDDQWDVLVHFGDLPGRSPTRRPLFADRLIHVRAPASDGPGGAEPPHLRLAQLDPPSAGKRRRLSSSSRPPRILFDDALAMLEAAASGAGVALTTATAARSFLAEGRLEVVSEEEAVHGHYWVDISPSGRLKPLARSLHDWLVAEHPPRPTGTTSRKSTRR